ncbi:MAG: Hsp70 family protein, partial [Lachnospiraceae bacterium]|nr:Hsp70 family protein [Lachnospiraceae bacterium]
DIDRYIANNYLLPQLLKTNEVENDAFTVKQKNAIANQLLGHAENMKKRLCNEDFNYLLSDSKAMDEAIASGHGISLDTSDLTIQTNNGALTIDKLWLSYADFIKTMEVFFKKSLFSSYTIEGHQKKYNSIQAAIDTALSKAHVTKNEIDYVIMIGGSSRNPFVQQRIKKYFKGATVMIPRELQALVSQGAALHSILSNGLGIQAVRPIVGETIVVVTQRGIVPVIKAGTEVPFSTVEKDAFTTGSKSYEQIEIPVCVGNDRKLLHNLKLQRLDGKIFPENTLVSLFFEMDSDKILHVKAKTLGECWEAKCENPLDNSAMTDGEAEVLKAQRESYVSAINNSSQPTAYALENLSRAYEANNQPFLAAETLEEKITYYPDSSLYNRIGVLFHNSGNYNRAIAYFRMAMKEEPNNATILNNLGNDLYLTGDYVKARP